MMASLCRRARLSSLGRSLPLAIPLRRARPTFMPNLTRFFREVLALPNDLLVYEASLRLRDLFPDHHILETEDSDFALVSFAESGGCFLALDGDAHVQSDAWWDASERRTDLTLRNGLLRVGWRGHEFRILCLHYGGDGGTARHYLVGPDPDVLDRFFAAVCRCESDAQGRVLEYRQGTFRADAKLKAALDPADFDRVHLAPEVRKRMLTDTVGFFASEATYAEVGAAWRRGILLTGPPGNGKTRSIRSLVARCGHPVITVRDLAGWRMTPQEGVQKLFRRARAIAPCVVVMEDLDSLVPKAALSTLLNELDGFASNRGMLVIATTNHPEKLDPAILRRPSRFDRRIAFDSPDESLREEALTAADARRPEARRIKKKDLREIVAATEGFSFAFLQELETSATLAWVDAPDVPFATHLRTTAAELRKSITTEDPPNPDHENDD